MTERDQPTAQPTQSEPDEANALALWGFWLSVAAYFLYDIGLLPLAAAGLSIGGFVRHDDARQRAGHKRLAGVGIAISAVAVLLYLDAYGHL